MKKVLIVEDDFYIRGIYRTTFEKAGYQMTEAVDGKEALEKIKKDVFDFIILDLMLPGISGMEVLQQAKVFSDTPIYVLTNLSDDLAVKQAMKAGAEAYFVKVNYTPKQLVREIEKAEASRTLPGASASPGASPKTPPAVAN